MQSLKEYIKKKRLQAQLKKLDFYWMQYNGTCFSELPSFYLTHTRRNRRILRKYVIIRICPQLYFSDTLFS